MITNDTIGKLVAKLEDAHRHFTAGTTPDKQWLDDVNWLVYYANKDIMNDEISLDGFVSEKEMKRQLAMKDNEIDDLEGQVSDLDDDNAKLQDMVDDLEDKVRELESKDN